jgi:hypothetical protein
MKILLLGAGGFILAQSEVTVIDPSAHMNRTILRAIEMVQLTQLCEAIAARVTVLIGRVSGSANAVLITFRASRQAG